MASIDLTGVLGRAQIVNQEDRAFTRGYLDNLRISKIILEIGSSLGRRERNLIFYSENNKSYLIAPFEINAKNIKTLFYTNTLIYKINEIRENFLKKYSKIEGNFYETFCNRTYIVLRPFFLEQEEYSKVKFQDLNINSIESFFVQMEDSGFLTIIKYQNKLPEKILACSVDFKETKYLNQSQGPNTIRYIFNDAIESCLSSMQRVG